MYANKFKHPFFIVYIPSYLRLCKLDFKKAYLPKIKLLTYLNLFSKWL